MLEKHVAGKTWGGQKEKDIYVIEFKRIHISCQIRGSDENLVCSPENRVLDLKKLHQSMASKYQIDGHYHAHFNCLEIDMINLNATFFDTSAVLEYLPYYATWGN